ncbi:MAG: hypothetical protein ACW98G_09085 [Candidatus Hodarchaeales archaeon]|jgi:hypothetical protein
MSSIEKLKSHIDILEKVEKYQHKAEFNRFLLILSISGFIAIIGGWISYIFNRFMGVDPAFFIFGVTGDPSLAPTQEPVMFLSVWMLYLVPIVSAISFSTGSTGIINWNKAYKRIGILALSLFILAHIMIVLLGVNNSEFITIIWGLLACVGFVISSKLLFVETGNPKVRSGLIILGAISLFLAIIIVIVVPIELAQLLFGSILGIILSFSGIISYFTIGRLA